MVVIIIHYVHSEYCCCAPLIQGIRYPVSLVSFVVPVLGTWDLVRVWPMYKMPPKIHSHLINARMKADKTRCKVVADGEAHR